MTRYPKLLPWLARKHALPVGLAEKLWRLALGEAIETLGACDTPEVHRFAIERLVDLLENESADASRTGPAPGTEWFWRHQRRMAALSFSATNATCVWWENCWKRSRTRQLLA